MKSEGQGRVLHVGPRSRRFYSAREATCDRCAVKELESLDGQHKEHVSMVWSSLPKRKRHQSALPGLPATQAWQCQTLLAPPEKPPPQEQPPPSPWGHASPSQLQSPQSSSSPSPGDCDEEIAQEIQQFLDSGALDALEDGEPAPTPAPAPALTPAPVPAPVPRLAETHEPTVVGTPTRQKAAPLELRTDERSRTRVPRCALDAAAAAATPTLTVNDAAALQAADICTMLEWAWRLAPVPGVQPTDEAQLKAATIVTARDDAGNLVGYAALALEPSEAYLLELHVHENWRRPTGGTGSAPGPRHRIGSRLVEAVKAAAAAQGTRVELTVATGDMAAPARALYEKAGFVVLHRASEYQVCVWRPEAPWVAHCRSGAAHNV